LNDKDCPKAEILEVSLDNTCNEYHRMKFKNKKTLVCKTVGEYVKGEGSVRVTIVAIEYSG
jgi:hypothetical protein